MKLWVDGASKGNPGPAKASVVFEEGKSVTMDLGKTTNNRAEYGALILALKTASSRGLDDLTVFTDSQLIDGHLNKGWKVYENRDLVDEAKALAMKFKRCRIVWVPREENKAHFD
ncbi:MAG: ribonuclease HI family protein [Promethearchaeati archaeon SRVP18_Atabeyarchaeia-1]